MSQSLFTSQTPALPDQSDGGLPGITTSTTMTFAKPGQVKAIRFFATLNRPFAATYTAELWELTNNTTGTRLANAAVAGSAITVGTWNVITFSSPVNVVTTKAYRAALNVADPGGGRYVATSSFFTSSALVNGDITGIKDGASPFGSVLNNGCFALNSAPNTLPSGSFSAGCYFIDVLFDATATSQSDFLPFFG